MRIVHTVRKIVGTIIAVLCFGAAVYALFKTMQYGSCSSGGNHVSTRACSPNSGRWDLMIFGGVPGGLLGLAVGYIKGFGADPKPAPPAVRTMPAGWSTTPARPLTVDRQQAPTPNDDALQRLERLTALRDAGALTPAEFERAKAGLLNEL